ncbi:hypothetical protein BZG36_02903 [Bifiguratus adelaidae]|uniref:Uncharacterized protein n=1 Tax=Bifiguratus adelaidae TaxID=1938954 RepID=A0A261Y1E6_9FUNG|nr:hypothetical protein BZG36_02903 [Bifiguratus adelaidae]
MEGRVPPGGRDSTNSVSDTGIVQCDAPVHVFEEDESAEKKSAQTEARLPPTFIPETVSQISKQIDQTHAQGTMASGIVNGARPLGRRLSGSSHVSAQSSRISASLASPSVPSSASPVVSDFPSTPTVPPGTFPDAKLGWNAFQDPNIDLRSLFPDSKSPTAPSFRSRSMSISSGAPSTKSATTSYQAFDSDLLAHFLKDQLYGQWYHNAGIVFVVAFASFVLGRFGAGLAVVIVFAAICATYFNTSLNRMRRNLRSDIKRELIATRLDDDVESLEWVNNFMSRFWIIFEPVLSGLVVAIVDSTLKDFTPSYIDSIRLSQFTLGTKPPRMEWVKTHPRTEPDVVWMDWKANFHPAEMGDTEYGGGTSRVNPKIVLSIRVGNGVVGAGYPILVENMAFSGLLRFRIKLMSRSPYVQHVGVSFLEKPLFDFSLKPIGGQTFGVDVMSLIPGLASFIQSQTHVILKPMMYEPNVFHLDIDALFNGPSAAELEAAIGIMTITVRSATGLHNMGAVGTCDPYVVISTQEDGELARTTIKENNTVPRWEETFHVLVHSLKDILSFELVDYNAKRRHVLLGYSNVDMRAFQEKPQAWNETLMVLRAGKVMGEFNVDMLYSPVTVASEMTEAQAIAYDAIETGIMTVSIYACSDLEGRRNAKSLNPYVKLLVNDKEKFKTHTIRRSTNPVFDEHFEMAVTDKRSVQLTFHIHEDRDVTDARGMGTLRISLVELLEALKEKQDWFKLEGSAKGKIRLGLIWRPVQMAGQSAPLRAVWTPPIGVVRFSIVGAKDLRNVEGITGGKSDPYVRIIDNGQVRARTSVIDNNLNPVWNEFLYVPVHNLGDQLIIECLDWNAVQKDRTLGVIGFNAKDVINVEDIGGKRHYTAIEQAPTWQPLRSIDENKAKGALRLRAEFYPSGSSPFFTSQSSAIWLTEDEVAKIVADVEAKLNRTADSKEEPPATSEPDEDKPETEMEPLPEAPVKPTIDAEALLAQQSGIFILTIHEAKLPADVSAFVEVYVDSGDRQYITKGSRGRSLHFNETTDFFVKEMDFSRIRLRIKDTSHMDEKTDLVLCQWSGQVKDLILMSLDALEVDQQEPGAGKSEVTPFWFSTDGNLPGQIQLSFRYIPLQDFRLDPNESIENQGFLKVTLLSAAGLRGVDRSGTSDPYIVAFCNGDRVFKSRVYKKTLTPTFKDEQFQIALKSKNSTEISFEVYDWDQIGRPTLLGVAKTDLRTTTLEAFEAKALNLPLSHNGEPAGQLECRVLWQPQLLITKKTGTVFNDATTITTMSSLEGSDEFTGITRINSKFGVFHKKNKKQSITSGTLNSDDASIISQGSFRSDRPSLFSRRTTSSPKSIVKQPSLASLNLTKTEDSLRQPSLASLNLTNTEDSVRSSSFVADQASISGHSHEGARGVLTIIVLAAKHLRSVDANGFSDPYVKLYTRSGVFFKTKIKKKNLAPEWNETTTLEVSQSTGPIMVKVKDYNALQNDVDLGKVELDLWRLIEPKEDDVSVFEDWFNLEPPGSGQIKIHLQFVPSPE